MSEVILVTAICGQCNGRLKGWYADHTEPGAGEYVHITVGVTNPGDGHAPFPVLASAEATDYDLWHVLPGMGW